MTNRSFDCTVPAVIRTMAQHEPRIDFRSSKYWQTHAAAVGVMNGRTASRFPRELRQVGDEFFTPNGEVGRQGEVGRGVMGCRL